jgi:hypothetical protein
MTTQSIALIILISLAVIQTSVYTIDWYNKKYPKYLRVYNYIKKIIAKEEAKQGYYSVTDLRYKLMVKYDLTSQESLECLEHGRDQSAEWFRKNIPCKYNTIAKF